MSELKAFYTLNNMILVPLVVTQKGDRLQYPDFYQLSVNRI